MRLFRERIETTEGVDHLLSSRTRRASFVPSRSLDRVGQPNQRPSLYPFILFRIDSISPVGRKPSRSVPKIENRTRIRVRDRRYSRIRRYKWRFMLAELTRRNLVRGRERGEKRSRSIKVEDREGIAERGSDRH